ncbi:AraC family transcriptional regulator [Dasania marina]|uniref:AraC family transcriptional regulator n=1 Tax=Dasania marina TaxID=471499 RepID=UPI00037DB301|nr:AraC family transcriptional regulator [Dasania marina]
MKDLYQHQFNTLLSSAKRKGLSTDAILKNIYIDQHGTQSTKPSYTQKQYSSLCKHICNTLNDEFLGLSNNSCKIYTFSTACKIAINSDDVGQFFKEMYDFYNLVNSDINVSLQQQNNYQALVLENKYQDYDIDNFLTEHILHNWHRLSCWITNDKIRPSYVEFNYPEPPHSYIYKSLFNCKIFFNRKQNALIFRKNIKNLPIIKKKNDLLKLLENLPDELLTAPTKDKCTRRQVEKLISTHIDYKNHVPTLKQTAEILHISPSTLSRKLSYENINYQKIKNKIIKKYIFKQLKETNIPISKISHTIGFSEPSTLNRAFKKWTGIPPSKYRAKMKVS